MGIKDGKRRKKEGNFSLDGVNLDIKSGEFIAVIGKIGAGKTTLVNSMMGELITYKGKARKNGKIALISQEAFLLNDTIRNNITFGLEYNEEYYNRVLDICELRPDLKIINGEDFAQIGEKGINLSGGQKQRINIARALYSKADIYLIDDALSALDAQVGMKILKNVFLGELKGKTRILVSHHLGLLDSVDKVLIMKKGKIVREGGYKGIKDSHEFRELQEKDTNSDEESSDIEIPEEKKSKLERKFQKN